MNGIDPNLPLLITAIGGFVVGIAGLFRSNRAVRKAREVSDQLPVVEGFKELQKSNRDQLDDLRGELGRVRKSHDEERKEWHSERRDLYRELTASHEKNRVCQKDLIKAITERDDLKDTVRKQGVQIATLKKKVNGGPK